MRLIGQLLSWLATILVIRLLEPSDYGLMALAQLLVGLATLLNEIGLTPALIQTRDASVAVIRSVFGYVLLTNVTLYLAVYLFAPSFSQFYDSDELSLVIRVLGVQLLIGGLGAVPLALAVRKMAFKQTSIIALAATVTASAASLAVAFYGGGVWALVTANLVLVSVQTIGIIIVTRFRLLPSLQPRGMRRLVSFGAWVSGSRLAWYFAESADDLLIGKIFGQQLLGFFNVAKNLSAMPMNRVMSIINQVSFPAYSRLEGDTDRALRYYLKSVWLALVLFCPIAWGLSSIADVFVAVLLGSNWERADFLLRVLALSIPIQALSFLLTPAIEAMGRPDLGFRNSIVRLVIFPLSIVVAIPWGIEAVAVSFIVGRTLALILFLRSVRVVFDIRFNMIADAARAPVAAGIAMYVCVSAFIYHASALGEGVSLLGGAILVGAVVYGAVLLGFDRDVVQNLRSTLSDR